MTVHELVLKTRIQAASEAILRENATIAGVASEFGFCDQSSFTTHFRKSTGITPLAFLANTAAARCRMGRVDGAEHSRCGESGAVRQTETRCVGEGERLLLHRLRSGSLLRETCGRGDGGIERPAPNTWETRAEHGVGRPAANMTGGWGDALNGGCPIWTKKCPIWTRHAVAAPAY